MHDDDNIDVTPTVPGDSGANGADPLYRQIYGDTGPVEVAPRRVGYPVAPPFTHYVLKPLKGRPHKTQNNVGTRIQVQVLEGPEGTPGFKFSDSSDVAFGFKVNRKDKDGNVLDDAAYLAKVRSRDGLLRRAARALGLAYHVPQPPGEFGDAAVAAYASQFERGAAFVADVKIEIGNDGVARNRIDWGSVAGLDEIIDDKTSKFFGKTAHEEAKAMIKLRDERGAKGAATAQATGRTTASLGPADLSQ